MTREPTLTRWADLRPQPWRNGGGVTREVATSPAEAGIDDFDWRVSIADVGQPGAFSVFPGVDRVIMLLEGPVMVLTVEGAEQVLVPRVPYAFRGDAAVDCRLPQGPTRDLNLMVRRGRGAGAVEVHPAGAPVSLAAGRHLVVALDDAVAVSSAEGEWALGRHDVLDAGQDGATLTVTGAFAAVRVP